MYFKKANKPLIIAAIVIIALGAIMAIFIWPTFLGIGIAVIGAAVLIFYGASREKDSDYDDRVKNKYGLFKNEKLYDLHEHINKNPLKIKVYDFGSPIFEGEDIEIKRGGDGIIRTSKYCSTVLLCDEVSDKITIYNMNFTVFGEDAEENTVTIDYRNIRNVEVTEIQFETVVFDKPLRTTYAKMVINLLNGEQQSFYIKSDASSDEIVSNLNRRIERIKTGA